MIDYLERLEAEVMKAARVEERRAQRPAVRIPRVAALRALAPVAAVAAAIALVVVLAPRTAEVEQRPATQLTAPPAAVIDSYSRGGEALIIDPDRYTLDAGGAEIRGDVAARAGRLVFASDPGGACAGRGAGEYAYRAERGALRLSVVSDPCPARAAELDAGAWTRDGG